MRRFCTPVVSQNEFRTVYKTMFPDISDDDLKAVWKQIDADGSGTLEVTELATFYGFSWDGDCANEMTAEQILDALRVRAVPDDPLPVHDCEGCVC